MFTDKTVLIINDIQKKIDILERRLKGEGFYVLTENEATKS